MERAYSRFTRFLYISLDMGLADKNMLERLVKVIRENEGQCPLYIDVKTDRQELLRLQSKKYRVEPGRKLVNSLQDIVGPENVRLNS